MKKIAFLYASVILAALILVLLGISLPGVAAQPQMTAAPSLSFAWARTWGGSYAGTNRIAVDAAGNIYVVGEFSGTVDFDPALTTTDVHTSANNSIDAFLSKFDPAGNFLWARIWGGGSGRDVAYGVGVDSSSNVYVVGAYRYTADFDPDPALVVTQTSNANHENNIYLSKFSPAGTFQWVRAWGPALITGRASFGAEAYTVVVTGTNLYVVGDFSGDQTDFNPWGAHDWHQNHVPVTGVVFFDSFLSKFDLNGNFVWAKTWGGEGYDDGPGVGVDSAGNIYVAGMYASQNINFDPAGGISGTGHPAHDSGIIVDVFLSKFDSNGDFQWVRTWGGQGTEDAMGSVELDAAGNVYVGGRYASLNCDFNPGGTPDIHSTNGGQDGFISKFAPDGTFQWARTWGGVGDDSAMGVAVDRDGNVYSGGWFTHTVDFDPGGGVVSHTSRGMRDAFVNQFDAAGNFYGVKVWGGSGNDMGGLTVDAAGNLYSGGSFSATVDFDPSVSGVDTHTIGGVSGAFLSKFVVSSPFSYFFYLPIIVRQR